MHLHTSEKTRFHAKREIVFTYFTNHDNFHDFVGYGPIPGINQVEVRSDGPTEGVGLIRDVHNTDGSKHLEEVVEFEFPKRIVDRITELKAPMKWLAHEVVDEFVFEQDNDGGTLLVRTFRINLRSFLLWPLGKVSFWFLSKAMKKHHARAIERITMNDKI